MKEQSSPTTTIRDVTSEDRLRFVVEFARMDLDTLRPGDWLNLWEDFLVFIMRPSADTAPVAYEAHGHVRLARKRVPHDAPGLARASRGTAYGVTTLQHGADPREEPCPLTPEEFRALQQDVRKWLDEQYPPLAPVHVEGGVSRTPSGAWIVSAPLHQQFLWHLLLLLYREELDTSRIRHCPECGALFSRVKNQEYCSRPCANRVAQRRFRERQEAETSPTA